MPAERGPAKEGGGTKALVSGVMRVGWFLGGLWLAGCGSKKETPSGSAPAATTAMQGASLPEANEVGRRLVLIDVLGRCEIRHRGVLFDLGSPSADGLEGWQFHVQPNTAVEREGATWLRVSTRSISYRFSLDEPQPVFFSARVKGLSSKSASLVLDGKPAGVLVLPRGQTKVVSSPTLANPVAAGNHTLTLRFSGSLKEGIDHAAEVDWLRVGFPDEDTSQFAAPTHGDVLQSFVSLGGVPHRSMALRVPSQVRCPVAIPQDARLRLSVAMVGSGEGEAEIRLLSDGQAVEVLKSLKVQGAEKPSWTDLDLPLQQQAGRQVSLELAALSGSRGSRMLFGDPRLVSPGEKPPPRRARAVVVVVVSSVNPARLPPWAPEKPLPTFDVLAREGAIFEQYRGASTAVGAVMGSLLTGLSPRQHGAEDGFARLPESLPTLATIARDASVHAVMFSAHPATSGAFGFARGWEKFVSYSPVSPALGVKPIEDVISWIGERSAKSTKKLFAVAHTRGIHPPFDLTPGEFAQLPPHPDREYAGPLDPRRAGQVIEKYRPRKRGAPRRWTEADNARLNAMMDLALAQTDRSLSNLIDALRKAGLWNDTLLVVTSDVASAADPQVLPFAGFIEPTEDALRLPLYVHFPGGAYAGERLQTPVSTVDLARTVLEALELEAAAPPGGGEDLFTLVEQHVGASERPLVASVGERLVVRWGNFRMVARERATPTLCDLASDPRCEHDVFERFPMMGQALWRAAYEHEAQAREPRFSRPKREPATLDPELAAALAVWGK